MAFWILPNTAGAVASNMSVDGGTTASSYNLHDLISGPRSRMWRANPFSSVLRIYYNLPSAYTMTHCVMARADLMMTENGSQVSILYGSGVGSPSGEGLIGDYQLIGIKVDGKPHGQDAAFEFENPITSNTFQAAIGHDSGTQAAMLSKLFFSRGLLLGDGPQPGPTWSVRRDGEPLTVKPLLGYEEYAVTDAIALRWNLLSFEDVAAFEAVHWGLPVFLFDTDGDIIAHKLEHVILANYSYSRVGADAFHLECVFNRLAYYP